jgi:CDP-diacylglycerol pyrophosphatase
MRAEKLIPEELIAGPTGFVRMLVETVQEEEALLDRLTLAVQAGSDDSAVVLIAREIAENRAGAGRAMAAQEGELPK